MADFSSVSIWIKVCMILIPLGGLCHLIGFASPYWISTYRTNMGIWKSCVNSICIDWLDSSFVPDWLRATQFFETIGLIAIGIAAAILFLSLVLQSLRNKKIVTILNALTCFVACGTIIVGAIIYASRGYNRSYLSWAFALCIVGAILEGVAGVLILVGSFANRS
ncbi:uncharacterized protein [Haliotis asinina]|uniref:uncharacterized protein isoform X2 n=1 Tax=Haliotis asinina TaxID=109174 RepID=UPI003531FE41